MDSLPWTRDQMSQAPANGNPGAYGQRMDGPMHEDDTVTMAAPMGDTNTVRLTKILHVDIKGSLNTFSSMGPDAATWKIMDGKQVGVFGSDDMCLDTQSGNPSSNMLNSDLSVATNSLRNATVVSARLLQSYNNFPVWPHLPSPAYSRIPLGRKLRPVPILTYWSIPK